MQGTQLTAGSVRQNYKESVKRLLSNENAFHLMSSVKGTSILEAILSRGTSNGDAIRNTDIFFDFVMC